MAHGPVCAVPGSETSDFEDRKQEITFPWPKLRYRVTVPRDTADDPRRAAFVTAVWARLEGKGRAAVDQARVLRLMRHDNLIMG